MGKDAAVTMLSAVDWTSTGTLLQRSRMKALAAQKFSYARFQLQGIHIHLDARLQARFSCQDLVVLSADVSIHIHLNDKKNRTEKI